MEYVFGPVPSRRLGQSLGIDPVPAKTCNWNCVYCQLGRTIPLTHERRSFFPRQAILDELQQALAQAPAGTIDWITFVGSGETTLSSDLGWLIYQAKRLSNLPLAVITNGSLLYLPEVRRDLAWADAVLPSLDAGTPELYRKLNRPHPEATFERLVEGLVEFRQMYRGKLWLELMLLKGINDDETALRQIANHVQRIRPDEVHINLPTRPPAESWVEPANDEGIMRAVAILGDVARVVHPADGSFNLGGCSTVLEAIAAIITRHPMRQAELEHALARWAPGQIQEALHQLQESGRAKVVERLGDQFWSAPAAYFPNATESLATAPNAVRPRPGEPAAPR
ncbi:MAG: radical SAM protein [Pseudomonadales bacterium]|nr:radical SAM protein [Ardenticatenaceae bacterium]MCP5190352.1 radical SAM protein [Pseudomonadales bacterium]